MEVREYKVSGMGLALAAVPGTRLDPIDDESERFHSHSQQMSSGPLLLSVLSLVIWLSPAIERGQN